MMAALKDKKSYNDDPKKNFHFIQLVATELQKQPPKRRKKKHIKLAIVSVGVDVVAKIDDDVYALSIIKIKCYFLFVFYCAKESRTVENNESAVVL